MLIQIAVLAWIFLGQALDAREMAGLALAFIGILAVQLAPRRPEATRVAAELAGPTDG